MRGRGLEREPQPVDVEVEAGSRGGMSPTESDKDTGRAMIEIEEGAWRVGQERYPATLQEVRTTTATGRSLLSVHLRSPITARHVVEAWFAHLDRDAALGPQVGAHVALRIWDGARPLPLDPRQLPSGRISAPEILHGLRAADVEEIVQVLREAAGTAGGDADGPHQPRCVLRRANGQWLFAACPPEFDLSGAEDDEPVGDTTSSLPGPATPLADALLSRPSRGAASDAGGRRDDHGASGPSSGRPGPSGDPRRPREGSAPRPSRPTDEPVAEPAEGVADGD